MSVRRHVVWFIVVVLALVLAAPGVSFGEEETTEPLQWEVVDVEDAPEEVGIWVDRHLAARGIYLLPAGEVRYLLVAWGEQPTGGYVLEVDSAESLQDCVRVNVKLTAPDPDDAVTEALTYPHQLLRLEAGQETVMVNFVGASWHGDALGPVSEHDPAIVLEAAVREDGVAPNPLVIRGRARVYEATFWLVLEDGHRHLSDDVLTASEAGPAWAEFEVAVTYADPTNPSGMVIGGYDDPSDGAYVEVAYEPVAFGSVSRPLPDIRGHSWAEGWIRMGVLEGFIDGYPDGTFGPEDTVTRAEFIKMLVASQVPASELPETRVSFPDVRGHWVEPYVAWAVEEWGIEDELGEMLFPDLMITREEMALLAVIAAGRSESEEEVAFDDAGDITPGFDGWVAAAVEEGLILGYGDGTFRPRAGLRRSEAVVVIWRVIGAREE
ncbi:MAG: S-layer homology domain-containing protein [Bacillota bacterium]